MTEIATTIFETHKKKPKKKRADLALIFKPVR